MAERPARTFEYAVELGRDERMTVDRGDGFPLAPGEGWTPEHLLLAGLVRCTIQSLRYHAGRAGHEVRAGGAASGRVTRRDADGRYAFVEIDCRIDVTLDPPTNEVDDLLAKAERDCFVGASLTVEPRYEWRIS
jgi:organic hydroperoxide reductase OsmC/OhrA